jgi:hypothetical protein
VGDPGLSLEERYGDEAGYRSRFRAAIERLVAERLLLAEDAAWLADQAPWRRAERPRRSSARTGE